MATLSRQPGARASKRAAVEAAVLAATEALLEEGRGYADLRVEEITTRAGISRTAFYFYFRDKRELLMRLTEDVSDALYAEAEAWWSGEGDGRVQLRAALEQIVGVYREHGVLLRAVVEASAYDDEVAEFWRALLGRFIEATQRRLEEELARGAIADVSPGPTAFTLCWMTERACYQWLMRGGDLGDAEFVRGLVGVWVRAVYGR
jgi:TetR/AcrR family transcriptional regulator, ethionamide resistance regulator